MEETGYQHHLCKVYGNNLPSHFLNFLVWILGLNVFAIKQISDRQNGTTS